MFLAIEFLVHQRVYLTRQEVTYSHLVLYFLVSLVNFTLLHIEYGLHVIILLLKFFLFLFDSHLSFFNGSDSFVLEITFET